MHPAWIVIFPLALSLDFYPVSYQPNDHKFGGTRPCPKIEMCNEDYLCNMWFRNGTEEAQCYLGKPENWTSNPSVKSYVNARSSNQCGDRDKYSNKQAVIDAFVDGFECDYIFKQLKLITSYSSKTVYFAFDGSHNIASVDLNKNNSNAPFTKDTYWKYYDIEISVSYSTSNYSYRQVNPSANNFTKVQGKNREIHVFCRNGKVYLDGENMKEQLTEFLIDGKRLFNL